MILEKVDKNRLLVTINLPAEMPTVALASLLIKITSAPMVETLTLAAKLHIPPLLLYW